MTEVLIVGAGPTGLMLACLLHRSGVKFRIIDKNEGPTLESRALGIQARSMELFHKLGLVEKFLEKGMIAKGGNVYVEGLLRMRINTEDMARMDTQFPYVFFLSQAETEKILLEDLISRNIQIERETEMTDFQDQGSDVFVTLQRKGERTEKISVRYLCGCDGAHSIVRRGLGLKFEGESYPSEFVMADAKVNWNLPYNKLNVFIEFGKVAVFFPLKDEQLSRVLSVSLLDKKQEPNTEDTTAFPATLDEVELGFREASHADVKLSDSTWVTRFHVHHRCVERMRVGNVFLLGDAAHIHSPAGAQGMNTGLQDANNLAWKLQHALEDLPFSDELLETYQDERHPVAVRLLKVTDRFFSLAMLKNKFFIGARNRFLPFVTNLMMKFPAGKRSLFRFISQLNIHYHPNLVVKDSFRAGPEAGMRVPNGHLEKHLLLHDLLKEYVYHLLIFKRDGFTPELIEKIETHWKKPYKIKFHFISLNDDNKEIFSQFGIKDTGTFLVRPDGYIGFKAHELFSPITYFQKSNMHRTSMRAARHKATVPSH